MEHEQVEYRFSTPVRSVRCIRYVDPEGGVHYQAWDDAANVQVAYQRGDAAQPFTVWVLALIGELLARDRVLQP